MKLKSSITSERKSRRGARGSAVLVVLVLLGIMAVYLTANSVTLHRLRVDLRMVEAKQMRKFREPVVVAAVERPAAATNEVARAGSRAGK